MSEGLGYSDGAFFHVGTDIESTVSRIEAGLGELQAAFRSADTFGFNEARANLVTAMSAGLDEVKAKTIATAQAMVAAFKTAAIEGAAAGRGFISPTGAPLAVSFDKLLEQATAAQARVIAASVSNLPARLQQHITSPGGYSNLNQYGPEVLQGTRSAVGTVFTQGVGELRGLPLSARPGLYSDIGVRHDSEVIGANVRQLMAVLESEAKVSKSAVYTSGATNQSDLKRRFIATMGYDPEAMTKFQERYAVGLFNRTTGGLGSEFVTPGTVAFQHGIGLRENREFNVQAAFQKAQQEQAQLADLLAKQASGQARFISGGVLKDTSGASPQYYQMTPGNRGAALLEEGNGKLAYIRQREAEAEARALQASQHSAQRETMGPGASFLGGVTQRGYFNPKEGVNFGLGGIAGTAGQFLRYSLVGAGIGAVTGILADTVREAKDFADSLTDVQNAIGGADRITVGYIGTLQELSRVAGSNVGSALDSAARSIRAFGDPSSQTAAQLREIGRAGAEAATQLSVITGLPLKESTGDVVAIANAFQQNSGFGEQAKSFDPNNLKQIGDAVANARRLGGDPREIQQGLAGVAEAAAKAGYNLNETASVLSLVIAKTDESGQAAATRLSRIFQIFQGQSGQSALSGVGINVAEPVKKQIEELAKLLPTLDAAKRNALIGRLGGTANLRELLPLLQDQKQLQKNFDEFLQNPGQGQKYFQQQVNNFAGLLKRLAGDVKNIQVDLVQSDIFAPFGIALRVLEPVLHAMDKLLNLYDRLPGSVKTLLAITLEFLGVSAALTAIHTRQAAAATEAAIAEGRLGAAERSAAGSGRFASAAGTVRAGVVGVPGAFRNAEVRGAAESGMSRQFIAGGGRFAAVQDAALGASTRITGALASLIDPVTAAIAALLVLGEGYSKYSDFNKAIASSADALKALSKAKTAGDFATAVSSYGTALQEAQGASGGFFGKLGLGLGVAGRGVGSLFHNVLELQNPLHPFAGTDPYKSANQYNALLAATQTAQRLAFRSQSENPTGTRASLATQLVNSQDLGSGLQQLSSQGVNAVDRLHAVADALGLVADQAGKVATKPGFYGSTSNLSALGDAALGYFNTDAYATGDKKNDTDRNKYASAVQDAILNRADKLGLSANKPLSKGEQQSLVQAALGASAGFKGSHNFFNDEDLKQVRIALLKVFVANTVADISKSSAPLSNDEVGAVIQAANDRAGDVNPLDVNSGKVAVQRALSLVNRAIARGTQSETALRSLLENRNQLEAQLIDATVAGLERLRTAAQSRAGSKGEVKRIGRDFFRREILAAVGNTNKLIEIMNNANTAEVHLIEQELRDLAAIKAAAARAEASKLAALSAAGAFDSDPNAAIAQSRAVGAANAAAAKAAKAAANVGAAAGQATAVNDPNGGAFDTGGGSTFDQGVNGSKNDSGSHLTAAQLAALRAEANVPVGNDIAQAAADIQSARADMAAAKGGSQEYYSALKQLHDAQFAYATAVQAEAHNERLLRIDMTNPVAMAREELRTALRKLAMDQRRGAGEFVTSGDKVQVKQDEAALERTKFEQRLQDAQTNDELGRISHTAYIRYLDREHDRLEKIKHRTRQQQEELNEVDQALKAANQQMEGQFNLGDIKVPTPYEVRRYIKAGTAGVTTQAVNTTNHVSVNGADFDKVKALIVKLLGPQATGQLSTGSRKG